MTVAVYDYLGYYNICHLGEEVRNPEKTIPRAVLLSIVIHGTSPMLLARFTEKEEPGVEPQRETPAVPAESSSQPVGSQIVTLEEVDRGKKRTFNPPLAQGVLWAG